jgi:hypothetical protein
LWTSVGTRLGNPPHPHQRATVEMVKNCKFLRRTHPREAEMVKPHGHSSEEGTTVTLQPQEAESIWPAAEGPPQYYTGAPSRAYCITAWFGKSTASDCKALQRVISSAERTNWRTLQALQDTYNTRCLRMAKKIIKDLSHLSHGLFPPLPS